MILYLKQIQNISSNSQNMHILLYDDLYFISFVAYIIKLALATLRILQQNNQYNQLIQTEKIMRLNDILLAVLNNTQVMKEKKINDMYNQMKDTLQKLGQVDSEQKSATEKAYLKAFMNVMQRVSEELMEARKKYEDLDKQKLKMDKCLKIAEDIKIFREECYSLKKSVKNVEEALKQQKLKADMLSREQDGLKKAIQKVAHNKKQNKRKYENLKSLVEGSEAEQDINTHPRVETTRQKTKTPLPININQSNNQNQLAVKRATNQNLNSIYKRRPKSTLQNYERRNHF